jgi:hypothetical protein
MEVVMATQELIELSDDELERIEGRVEAASPGPWFSYVAGRDPDVSSSCIEIGSCNELGSFGTIELTGSTTADQDFIASARQDLPRLVREVRVLRARLQFLREFHMDTELAPNGGLVGSLANLCPA